MITIVERLFKDLERFGLKVVESKIKFYLENEKQHIINSYNDGQSHSISNYKDGKDYYNKVFNNK